MDIQLTDDEARTLRDMLEEFLPELKYEAARTEEKQLRHVLYQREALVERLVPILPAD
jgi:hypothetical protein